MSHYQYRLDEIRRKMAAYGGDEEGYIAYFHDLTPDQARQYYEQDLRGLYAAGREREAALARRKHWTKLPAITRGYTRIPDDKNGTRMVRCEKCGAEMSSLSIGYHQQRKDH